MVKLTGPKNIGSAKIGDEMFTPDEDGCLYVPDDLNARVIEVLKSHGFVPVGWQCGSAPTGETE